MHRNMWYGKAILAFVPSSSKKYWVPYPLSRRNPKSNNKSNLSAKKFSGMKHSPVQQMNNPNWWNTNSNMHPTTLHSLPQFLPSSDSSSSSSFCSSSSASPSFFHHYTLSNSLPVPYLHDHQDLTQPWSQLFSADVVGEHGERNFSQMEHKNAENWVDQVVFPSASVPISDVKQETTWHGNNFQTVLKSSLSEFLPAFSTRSSMMSSVSSIVNYNNRKAASHQLHHSSKCNKTGAGSTLKKARVQSATFKVRKEKLGDRIAALHQLVSPFGKTDTASVLLEATAYIRFHQRQIEALISSYLTSSAPSSCIRQPVLEGETRTDLKSRGLCLVPVNCTLQLCSNNAADYLSPSFGGGFG